jgi:hypothetical protein
LFIDKDLSIARKPLGNKCKWGRVSSKAEVLMVIAELSPGLLRSLSPNVISETGRLKIVRKKLRCCSSFIVMKNLFPNHKVPHGIIGANS